MISKVLRLVYLKPAFERVLLVITRLTSHRTNSGVKHEKRALSSSAEYRRQLRVDLMRFVRCVTLVHPRENVGSYFAFCFFSPS